ncbi:DUF2142 domain-containing protein [Frankia sp. Cas4]|uniref:DUF2142 domain-containing protein n=1 Tax=Frankia sp. Cas4 TaxID=3073927 RepID=UPI002AD25F71|nr:DUF2142 domain-containing protein [Frankia sp. Cas4]
MTVVGVRDGGVRDAGVQDAGVQDAEAFGSRPTHAAAAGRFGPLELVRRTPAHIWLVTGLFSLLLACWSVLVPQYHAPDEPNHVDAIMRLVQGDGWPRPGNAFVTADGVGAIAVSPFGSPADPYDLTVDPVPERDAVARSARPAWDRLANPGQPPGSIQQLVQHPPLYYWVNATILAAFPGGGDTLRWDVTIGLLRMISVAMVAPLPLLAYAATRRLHPSPLAATVAALTPFAVPQLVHIGSSVNNDNLLVLLGALVTVAVAHILTGDTSARTAGWTGLLTGLALLTKSFAVVLVAMVGAAYVISWLRGARPSRSSIALCSFMIIGAGGWWWLVNIIRWGAFQPRTPGFPPGRYVGSDWTVYWSWMSQGLLGRWWGSIGWYEVDLPLPLVLAASGVVAGLAACAVIRTAGRRNRTNLVFMLWPTSALLVVVAVGAAMHVADTGHITGVSGRYLFTGFTGIAVLVGTGTATLRPRFARWMPLALLTAAVGMQAESISEVVTYFWRPPAGGVTEAWHAMTAWSPWPTVVVEVVFVSTVVLTVVTAVAVTRAWREPTGGRTARAATPAVAGATCAELDTVPAELDTVPAGRDTVPAELDTVPAGRAQRSPATIEVIDTRRLDASVRHRQGPDLPPVVSLSGNVTLLGQPGKPGGRWPLPPRTVRPPDEDAS